MSKRSSKLFILLAALIVLVGVSYFVISSENAKNATSTEATEATLGSFQILSIDPQTIDRVSWTYSDWESQEICLKNGYWVAESDLSLTLLTDVVYESFLNALEDVQAYKELPAENLVDYGLSVPYATAYVHTTDGKTTILDFGDSSAVSGYCYMRLNEEGPVYMVRRALKANFGKVLKNFTTTSTATR